MLMHINELRGRGEEEEEGGCRQIHTEVKKWGEREEICGDDKSRCYARGVRRR